MSSLTEPAPTDPSDLPWIKVSPVLLINLRQYILREERPWNAEERAGLVRQIGLALDRTEHWRSLVPRDEFGEPDWPTRVKE